MTSEQLDTKHIYKVVDYIDNRSLAVSIFSKANLDKLTYFVNFNDEPVFVTQDKIDALKVYNSIPKFSPEAVLFNAAQLWKPFLKGYNN